MLPVRPRSCPLVRSIHQRSALPLSYGSKPPEFVSFLRWPHPLPRECSTTELRQLFRALTPRRTCRAGDACHKGVGGASTGKHGRCGTEMGVLGMRRNLSHSLRPGASVAAGGPPWLKPAMTDKSQKRDTRAQRLGAALRENLKRRKAQARGRGSAAEEPGQSAAKPVTQGKPAAGDKS